MTEDLSDDKLKATRLNEKIRWNCELFFYG